MFAIAAVMILLASFLVACSGTPSGGSTKATTITIGDLAPYSGSVAVGMNHQRDGTKMAIEEINAAGGIKSLGGAKIELLSLDNEFKADATQAVAQQLVNNPKVSAIIYGAPSAYAVMVGKMADQANIAMWAMSTNTPAKTQQGFKTIFSIYPNSDMLGYYALQYIEFMGKTYLSSPPKNIAVLNADTEFNNTVAASIIKHASSFNLKVAGVVPYPYPSTDVTPYILKAKALGADMLLISETGEGIQIERALDSQGWDPLRIGILNAYMNTDTIKTLGAKAENLLGTAYFSDSSNADAAKFAQKFTAKYNYPADSYPAQGYQLMYALAAAIEKAGSTDRAAIVKASQALVYTPADGPMITPYKSIKFDATGQTPMDQLATPGIQVQGGKFVSLFPQATGATMKFNDAWKQWKK
jgi:branched-chain amino acid transport system substrate-binding protein